MKEYFVNLGWVSRSLTKTLPAGLFTELFLYDLVTNGEAKRSTESAAPASAWDDSNNRSSIEDALQIIERLRIRGLNQGRVFRTCFDTGLLRLLIFLLMQLDNCDQVKLTVPSSHAASVPSSRLNRLLARIK